MKTTLPMIRSVKSLNEIYWLTETLQDELYSNEVLREYFELVKDTIHTLQNTRSNVEQIKENLLSKLRLFDTATKRKTQFSKDESYV